MSFNIERLKEIAALEEDIEIIGADEVSRCFDWLEEHFSLPYGQIDWKKVPRSKTKKIDGLNKGQVLRHLLTLGFDGDQRFTGIWSDAEEGFTVTARLAFEHYEHLWYPAKEDLWLITKDRDACIEFHHEGWIGSAKL